MAQGRDKPFSIGHVSKLVGVNVATLRSWEKQGLIAPSRSDGGRRTFDAADVSRLSEIVRLRKVLGYGLSGIRRHLEADDGPPAPANEPGQPSALDTVGSRVRAMRRAAGLSLRELAERSGVTASHLSNFERGAAFPSPPRLAAIARVLGTSLAELLGPTALDGRVVIRRGEGRLVTSLGPKVAVEQLTVGEALMDCEIWTLAPGAESEGFYEHEGQELVHVLDGAVELAIAGGPAETLAAGDSAYFDSTRPHRWRNAAAVRAVVLWVNTDTARLSTLKTPREAVAPLRADLGERSLLLHLPEGYSAFRVIDTHTAGHPTRILLDPVEGLDGATVAAKRDAFRARHDALRTRLLHEPRGHAATFGLVPVPSDRADFGAIFVSTYKYLDMCGHGTIGFARALRALGRVAEEGRFTLEVPAGIVSVELGVGGAVTLENVASFVAETAVPLADLDPALPEDLVADVAYGGCWYALVPAAATGFVIAPENVGAFLALGARIKRALNARGGVEIDSTLFYQEAGGRHRQIVVLESNKFDRSPCGTGMSARLAQLARAGRVRPGEEILIENVLGVPFRGVVARETEAEGRPAIVPRITGSAHVTGLSTLVIEAGDPLADGFLCR